MSTIRTGAGADAARAGTATAAAMTGTDQAAAFVTDRRETLCETS
ncbi:hypothetical protein [Microbacterium sp. NPDC056052]